MSDENILITGEGEVVFTSETQNFVKSQPIENINIPALETKALEEKHGINLSKGQRTDKTIYADEWNRRGTDSRIQELFNSQPQQFVDAFDRLFDKHASNIGEINKEWGIRIQQ